MPRYRRYSKRKYKKRYYKKKYKRYYKRKYAKKAIKKPEVMNVTGELTFGAQEGLYKTSLVCALVQVFEASVKPLVFLTSDQTKPVLSKFLFLSKTNILAHKFSLFVKLCNK